MLRMLSKLAWRNLWRNHRRTIIMLSAISVGVWSMIFMTALMRGMLSQMIIDGVEALPGHVQVHNPGFPDDPSIANRIPLSDEQLEEMYGDGDFVAWASRVRVPAVVTSERASRGLTLLGIDPDAERNVMFIDEDAVDGRFLESSDDRGVVIGRKLAETLETEIGKRVVLMSQDPNNDIADRGFRIVGLYTASTAAVEEAFAFVGKTTAQQMLGVEGQTTEVFFVGDDYRNVEPVYEAVAAEAPDTVLVRRWTEADAYLSAMLPILDAIIYIMVVIIFVALSFGLVNTLVMAVFERIREIGLMLALGMQPRAILGQILIESMLLLSFGLAIGNTLAWLSVKPLEGGISIAAVGEGLEMMNASSTIYPQLLMQDMVAATIVVLVLGFLASLSPAWRASRYQPVEAITKAS